MTESVNKSPLGDYNKSLSRKMRTLVPVEAKLQADINSTISESSFITAKQISGIKGIELSEISLSLRGS